MTIENLISIIEEIQEKLNETKEKLSKDDVNEKFIQVTKMRIIDAWRIVCKEK